jgi:urease beta subunit
MIPGEYLLGEGDIVANAGRRTVELTVANTADRPIQVGFALSFLRGQPRASLRSAQAFGMRLNIPPAPPCASSPATRSA